MNTISRTVLRLAAAAAMTAGFALAQSSNALTAAIPFDFTVGHTNLPAGEYTITTNLISGCVQIRDSQDRVQASVVTIRVSPPSNPEKSQLGFRVYGGKHYLASTWDGMLGLGRAWPKSSAEREAEMAGVEPTTTVLIARK